MRFTLPQLAVHPSTSPDVLLLDFVANESVKIVCRANVLREKKDKVEKSPTLKLCEDDVELFGGVHKAIKVARSGHFTVCRSRECYSTVIVCYDACRTLQPNRPLRTCSWLAHVGVDRRLYLVIVYFPTDAELEVTLHPGPKSETKAHGFLIPPFSPDVIRCKVGD